MLDCFDDPTDIFGSRVDEIISLMDDISGIDLDAAAFLYVRVYQESANGTMTLEQIIDMLKDSYDQLEKLARNGLLYVPAA